MVTFGVEKPNIWVIEDFQHLEWDSGQLSCEEVLSGAQITHCGRDGGTQVQGHEKEPRGGHER